MDGDEDDTLLISKEFLSTASGVGNVLVLATNTVSAAASTEKTSYLRGFKTCVCEWFVKKFKPLRRKSTKS